MDIDIGDVLWYTYCIIALISIVLLTVIAIITPRMINNCNYKKDVDIYSQK